MSRLSGEREKLQLPFRIPVQLHVTPSPVMLSANGGSMQDTQSRTSTLTWLGPPAGFVLAVMATSLPRAGASLAVPVAAVVSGAAIPA
jgi:hypothetical protein